MVPTPRQAVIHVAYAAAVIATVSLQAFAAPGDDELLVSPGSPILEGLQSMSAGADVSVLFEAREIFRLAHRHDAVAAIDGHLERVAIARAAGMTPPAARTVGEILVASPTPEDSAARQALHTAALAGRPIVNLPELTVEVRNAATAEAILVTWHDVDQAGVERARRWLREIGCERRGACVPSRFAKYLDDPILLMRVIAGAAGVLVASSCAAARRRMRAGFVATAVIMAVITALLIVIGVGNLAIAAVVIAINATIPYLVGLVAGVLLIDFFFPRDTTPAPAAE